MAKKYLLYIHDPLFDKETEKSKLINNLLERHYHGTVDGGKPQEDVHAEIETKQAEVRSQPKNTGKCLHGMHPFWCTECDE